MTTQNTNPASSLPAVCPRCGSKGIKLVTKSPVPDVWSVFKCDTCIYTWRNTEPEINTDPKQYPDKFKVKVSDLGHLFEMPSIPPLREK